MLKNRPAIRYHRGTSRPEQFGFNDDLFVFWKSKKERHICRGFMLSRQMIGCPYYVNSMMAAASVPTDSATTMPPSIR